MLQLKASIVDDDGTVAVFPYQVEHPRFAAKKAGPSVWTMLRKDEVEKVSGGRGMDKHYPANRQDHGFGNSPNSTRTIRFRVDCPIW